MKKVCENWEQAFPSGSVGNQFYDEFATRAKNVSAEVFRVKTPTEAKAIVASLAKSVNAKKAVVIESPLINASGVVEELKGMGIANYTVATDIAEHAESADIGLSTVEFGIAETGSVCMDGYSFESRIVSMLPPLHIVFLKTNNVVADVNTAFEIFSKVFDKGYVSFITGPSRTADIERVLTIGVHGPSRFAIIAIDEATNGGAN